MRTTPRLEHIFLSLRAAGVAALVGLCAYVSIRFFTVPPEGTAIWPASGILLALLLAESSTTWPVWLGASFVGFTLGQLGTGRELIYGMELAAVSLIGPVVGAVLIRRFVGLPAPLTRLKSISGLAVWGCLAGSGLGALCGAALASFVEKADFLTIWWHWWIGDVVAVTAFTPVLLDLVARSQRPVMLVPKGRRLEIAVVTLATAATVWVVFASPPGTQATRYPYVVYTLLLWLAVRSGPRLVALALPLLAAMAAACTVSGLGAFVSPGTGLEDDVLIAQVYLIVGSLSSLVLAALVSERAATNEALRQSQEHLQGIIENSPVAIYVKDLEGRYLLANPPVAAVLQAPLPTILGTRSRDYLPPKTAQYLERCEREVVTKGESLRFEDHIEVGDETLVFRSARFPLRDETGRIIGIGGISHEITDMKRLETDRELLLERERQARIEAERLVVEAQRLNRVKDDFLLTLSHELRTPLSAILGWAELLANPVADAETQSKAVAIIERNARTQVRIIDDLLDVSAIISGSLKLDRLTVDLAELVSSASASAKPAAAGRDVTLIYVPPRTSVLITGDEFRLQQIITNLLTNAIKFTPKGGTVTVSVDTEKDRVKLRVVDTGIGISQEALPHVFERFWQADSSTTRRYGGLGLGLAIVRELVELHGGDVVVASDGPGRGAAFTVSLPLPEVVHASAPPAAARPFSGLGGLKVLVVDDEADARDMVAYSLTSRGGDVKVAGATGEAFALLVAWRPDILLCDIGLPGEDGYGLIKRVRALPPGDGGRTPAIALTAFAGAVARARALAAGFQDHLPKPVELDRLAAVVERVFERRELP